MGGRRETDKAAAPAAETVGPASRPPVDVDVDVEVDVEVDVDVDEGRTAHENTGLGAHERGGSTHRVSHGRRAWPVAIRQDLDRAYRAASTPGEPARRRGRRR